MEDLWIVHRQAAPRAALERLARGVAASVRAGAPSDPVFDESPVPPAVLLCLSGDLEEELEFARRHGERRGDSYWMVLRAPRHSAQRVDHLFAGLAASHWPASPEPAALRTLLAEAIDGPGPLPLSARRRRQTLERLCERFFADLELPFLQGGGPLIPDRVLIQGESGTGRLLLARALHARSAEADDAFVALPCGPESSVASLLEQARSERGTAPTLTLCLDEADRLAPQVRRSLLGRIERGDLLPADLGARRLRWLASARGSVPADQELLGFLGAVRVSLPPLRERPAALASFANAVAADWCESRSRPLVGFAPEALRALGEQPWLENFRELESVIVRTLAHAPGNPIEADELCFDEPHLEKHAAAPLPPLTAVPKPADPEPQPEMEGGNRAGLRAPGPAELSDEPPSSQGVPGSSLSTGKLAGAVAHAVRNPLVAIGTFATLLPDRYEDPDFRGRFREQVTEDVGQIESVLDRMARFASFGEPRLTPVDVTGTLEGLLEEWRPEIQERRLLVLQELDTTRPLALADEEMLRFALDGLLSRALRWVPERADLFVASKYHPLGPQGKPAVRVLLRFFNPVTHGGAGSVSPNAAADVSEQGTALEFVMAQHLIEVQGGALRIDATEADETLVLMDLPAP